MKVAMTENIHVRSFRNFIADRLPAALAAVVPLRDYRAEPVGPGVGRVTFSLERGPSQLTVVFDNVPFPREDGSFLLDGEERAVFMTASSNNLEGAEIRAVGEQLMGEIGPRIAPPPAESEWDEAVLRAWFPLGRWLREFLREAETSQFLDNTNSLTRLTHLRRVFVTGDDVSFHPSQIGRVCPLETPEGPNVGRVLTMAVGADVRDGRIVPSADQGEAVLGPSTSLVPLLCHNDPSRVLMGANMMRQWLPQVEPELPLVRSGNEPEDGSLSAGRNFLTAYVHWKGMNYEDAIVMSESAAVRLASPGPLEVGDKLSNRHGAKGVVGAILPDDQMPHLPDGRPVDLIFDAMGVYSRLNFGQIIEAALGMIAEKKGKPFVAPPFRRTSPEELHSLLRKAGLPESGQFTLRDGKNGPALDEASTVGIVYWGKLIHLAGEKTRHRLSPGDIFRGMMSGRNEYLALRAIGANENIRDAYLTRAPLDDKADELLASAAEGFLSEGGKPPSAAFQRVQRALRTAMIDLAWHGDRVTVSWAEPDEGDVALAEPVPHPWLPGARLTHIGPSDWDIYRYRFEEKRPSVASVGQSVLEANESLGQAVRSGAPAAVREAARGALHRAVQELFASLLTSGDIDFYTRMQFTARAVLAPGYDLRLGEVGLAEEIAWALFGPVVVGRVGAEAVQSRNRKARQAVEGLMAESVVVINRAPTWEPTCITAFTPVMAPDLCIRLHPLCCRLFNGDFDGDQAAVWLPISEPAQREAKEKLTLAGHLRRDPSVVVMHLTPSHAVLAGLAYALESTEGRREFDAMWPAGSKPPAPPLTRADLAMRLLEVLEIHGAEVLLNLLDSLYTFGIAQATKSGASFSPFAGEGLRLPPPPASDASPSWDAYRSLLDSAIMSSADADPTMKAPMRALRCGARGSVAALRATLGPWAVSGPFDVGGPIRHGFRDGLTAEELWLWASRARAALQDIHRSQVELAKTSRFTGDLTVLRRAMSSDDPGKVFAEAAEIGESEPLTDPDVRLWAGLLPSATGNSQSE